ncbi:ABC transporter permease [Streptacidiphilus sp. ASG 303]|uniref:ABC transporter permease n=1 Tax=Streptacidiphilus sp. ASG 303 TaxID=2896847 RepID=UPI001E3B4D2C|nr:ABC transporter permease [Streptacidiphilus sp. ASG 303]MCD0483888.1 ABC transporter permease [Streptacidiphilus sp. ASG 303]
MFRTALRNVLAHKARLLMTTLAVLLGTAFVAGTLVFTDTLGEALKNSSARSFSDISVAVTDPAADAYAGAAQRNRRGPALTEDVLRRISAADGVAGARGVVTGFAGVADRAGALIGDGWSTTGTNFAPGAGGRDPRYPMAEGRGPSGPGEAALDAATAAKGGLRVGDTVRVAVNGPVMRLRLTGVFRTDDPRVSSGGSLVLFDTPTAQRLYLTPGRYSEIDAAAAPGTSETALLGRIEGLLPKGGALKAETGRRLADDQAAQIARATDNLSTALLAFAGIALFVGVFLIANTFTMLVAQRTRELALLRAVGASRRQVTRSVLAEALAVGVAASLGGLAAGVGIAVGMRAVMGATGVDLPDGPLVVTPSTVLVSLAVGTLVTVLAAWLPARRAATIPPVAAMSSAELPASQRSLRVRNSLGAALAVLGAAAVVYGASTGGSAGRMPVAVGAVLVLVGVFVLTPLLSRPVIALAGPLLGGAFGVSGRLARRNAVRNPRRTAATASALTVGVTLISALSVIGASVGAAVDRAVTDGMKADYMVSMANYASLSPEVARGIAKVPGVSAVSPVESVPLRLGGRSQEVSGVDAAALGELVEVRMRSGSAGALAQGRLLVRADVARERGWRTGSAVRAAYPDGSRARLVVGGVFEENALLSEAVLAGRVLDPHVRQPYVRQVLVKGADGAGPALQRALRDATGDNPLIKVEDRDGVRASFSGKIGFLLNLLYGLLAMAVLIAVLGVVNTLAMSVFERRREIGMLRAVGLDRSGVKRMVRLESLVISLFGAVLGIGLGTFLAWAVNGTLRAELDGLTTVVPPATVGYLLAGAAVIGLLAALWPARRASRLDVLESIKAA